MIPVFLAVGAVLSIFIVISIIRVMMGPTVADRAVALDTINTLVIASMISLGAAYDNVIYVDVAIVYAILSFISTLYIAKYLEGDL